MCMNCGCNMPDDKHGNESNISLDDLRRAGQANGQEVDEVISNIEQTYQSAVEGADMGNRQDH